MYDILKKKKILYLFIFLFILYFYHDYNKNLNFKKSSDLYSRVIVSLYNSDFHTVVNLSNFLINNYKETYYCDCCMLILSNISYMKNDISNSILFLKNIIINDSKIYLKNVSVIRLCKVLYINNMFDEAFELINRFKNNIYLSLYEEIKGDMFYYMNINDKAKDAYYISFLNIGSYYNTFSIKIKINNSGFIV